jgi:hypothetical protein
MARTFLLESKSLILQHVDIQFKHRELLPYSIFKINPWTVFWVCNGVKLLTDIARTKTEFELPVLAMIGTECRR